MNSARVLRPNFLVILLVVAGVVILGVDRFVEQPLSRAAAANLYEWGLLISAFALVLGLLNVAWVHLRRVLLGGAGWPHSLALLVSLLLVLVTGLLSPAGVDGPLVEWLFDAVIAPGQATLFALLALFMAAAAYRFLRVGRPGGAWMLAGALVVLAVQMPLANVALPSQVSVWAGWLLDVPVMATVRGALLGGSLALIVSGLRYLAASR
jgi:hypothetical protein